MIASAAGRTAAADRDERLAPEPGGYDSGVDVDLSVHGELLVLRQSGTTKVASPAK